MSDFSIINGVATFTSGSYVTGSDGQVTSSIVVGKWEVDPDDGNSIQLRVPSASFGGDDDRIAFYVSGSGKIGVGTKNPTNDFEVAGSGKAVFTKLTTTALHDAQGLISASGTVSASIIHAANTYVTTAVNTPRINTIPATADLYVSTGLHVAAGDITASGNISASGELTGFVGYNQHSTSSFTVGRGEVVRFGSGTSAAGKIYHYKSDGSWELADCTGIATSDGMLAVALGTDPDQHGMLLRGMCKVHTIQGTEAVGDVLYLSETAAGTVDCVAPAASDEVVRVLGYCLHASDKLMWFDPDKTWVEIA
jgi:hypothetical protein